MTKEMLIGRSDIEACVEIPIKMDISTKVLSVDVAGDGRDSSVLCLVEISKTNDGSIKKMKVVKLREFIGLDDTMFLTNLARQWSLDNGNCRIIADGIGVGKGLVDRLHELGSNVMGFIAGTRAWDKERFINARAEQFYMLKLLIEAKQISLLPNVKMVDQLSNIPFSFREDGKLKILSKEDMVKKRLKSPDIADCLMISLYGSRIPEIDSEILKRNTQLLYQYK